MGLHWAHQGIINCNTKRGAVSGEDLITFPTLTLLFLSRTRTTEIVRGKIQVGELRKATGKLPFATVRPLQQTGR